jgi:hypothetical protein
VEHANYIAKLFTEMDHLGHLLFLIVLAFFVGYLNFSFLWILGMLYLVYKIDAVRQHKLFKSQKREKKREEIMQNTASVRTCVLLRSLHNLEMVQIKAICF